MNKKLHVILNSIYSVTLLICFIVNLTVSKKLSWFFIVLSAMLMTFTLTSLYNYISKYKTFKISISFISSLILLLGIINIYTMSNWFLVATSPILFTYLVIFIPVLIKIYPVPQKLKSHNAIISFCINLISLLLLLIVIKNYSNGNWLFTIAYPIVVSSSVLPFSLITVIRYLKINWAYKTSLSFIINAIFFLGFNIFLSNLLNYELSYKYNLTNWSNGYVTGNIHILIFTSLITLALLFGGVGIKFNKTTYKVNTITE